MESLNKLLSFKRKSLNLHSVYNAQYQYIEEFENTTEEEISI